MGVRAWLEVHPAVAPVVALIGGALLARGCVEVPVGASLGLAVLGGAWRGPLGRVVAGLGVGLALGWIHLASPALDDPPLDPSRPVVALVRATAAYRPAEGGWSAPARVVSMRQGPAVALAAPPVWLTVAADQPPAAVELWVRGTLKPGERPPNGLPGPAGLVRLHAKSERLVEPRARGGAASALAEVGRWARRRLERMPAEEAAHPGVRLALALVLGESWRLEPEVRDALRLWGLAHLTAASGLHLGMVAAACAGAVAWTSGARRWFLPALAVVLYCGLVGGRPSLLRAALMLGLAWVARGARRSSRAIDGLCVAAAALVLADPRVLDDVGFRLSFAATAGIVLYGPVLRRAWRALPSWMATPLSVAVAAQLFTAPFTVSSFSSLPLAAPLLNLLFVPWTAGALLASFAWVGLRLAGAPLAAAWLAPWAAPFGLLPALPAPLWVAPPLAVSLGAGAVAAVLAGWLLARPRLAAIAVLGLALWLAAGGGGAREPELWMLDVGQGDALVLRSGRRTVLIDGGGWRRGDFAGRVLLPALLRRGVRRIDLAILSHADVDHCGGLLGAARRLPIAELWTGAEPGSGGCGDQLANLLGHRARRVAGGETARIGEWRLQVAPRAAGGDDNRRSLVVRAEASGRVVLLTGDLDAAGEGMLRGSGFDLRADVLKVAHHGSRSSSGSRFLESVSPRHALVSAGRGNAYGHPSPVVTERLRDRGVTVWRSDLDGLVLLQFPVAGPIRVATERPRVWPADAP
ncbi:MAG TPA: ComEC/Rec2 family competence protein [Thermoanaerobaculia bacterium]|nr:ComEC/Rec2 family competence protein [Thermoanaerobaculia bacterium]